MKYYIDLRNVNSPEQLHDVLEEALPLPEYYGRNLDALYDILTSLPEAFRLPEPDACDEPGGDTAEDEPDATDLIQRDTPDDEYCGDEDFIFVFTGSFEAENAAASDYIHRLKRMCSRIEKEEENLKFIWE